MHYTIKKADFGKICRTCLSQKENMSLIFTKELLKMFRSLTKLKVTKTDGLPELICSDCSEQVNRSYNFKLLCENSNKLLHQINKSEKSPKREICPKVEEKVEPVESIDEVVLNVKAELKPAVDESFEGFNGYTETLDPEKIKPDLFENEDVQGTEINDMACDDVKDEDRGFSSDESLYDDSSKLDNNGDDNSANSKHVSDEQGDLKPVRKKSSDSCTSDDYFGPPNTGILNSTYDPLTAEKQSITGMRVKKAIMMGPDMCDPTTLTCKICDKVLVNIYSLGRHMEMHDDDREFRHTCHVCNKGFYEKGQLTKHIRRHKGETRYKCELCSKGFYELSAVAVHMKKHKVKPTPCPTCKKPFYVRQQLEIHIAKKHPTDRHTCAKCGKEFQNARYLQVHQLVHVKVRMFPCLLCDKSFKNDESLRKHHKRVHVEEPKLEICNVCGKAVKLMKTHLMKHSGERPFKCEQCPRAYISKSQLKTHRDVKHGDGARTRKYPFLCSICGKPCQTTTQLRNHTRKHTGERPFNCRLCDKKYKTNGALTIHLRSHTEERPYVCDVCHKGFYTSTILKHHVRTHTGERPHKCDICGRAFSQNSSLKTHMKVH